MKLEHVLSNLGPLQVDQVWNDKRLLGSFMAKHDVSLRDIRVSPEHRTNRLLYYFENDSRAYTMDEIKNSLMGGREPCFD